MGEKWSKAPKLALWGGEGEGMGRTYVDPTTDLRYPSVTTVLKGTPKADLNRWVAMKVAEKARDRPDIVLGDPDTVVARLINAPNEYRDERGWVGSGVHATIQSDHEGTWDYHELNPEQLRIMGNWEKFCRTYQVRILRSEVTILGDGYMGTFDAIIEYTDPLTGEVHVALVDFKTSKSTWPEHHMQLAALARATAAFREVPEGAEGAVLRKGKTKAQNSWWLKEEMPAFDSVAIIHLREDMWDFIPVENIDLQHRKFMCYVELQNLDAQLKERGQA